VLWPGFFGSLEAYARENGVHPVKPFSLVLVMAYLEVENGRKRTRVDLKEDAFLIGRKASCALVLDDPEVSREHARIVRTATGYTIEDLESRYGTFVNGRRITGPTFLEEGDLVVICGSALTFHGSAIERKKARLAPAPDSVIVSTLDAARAEEQVCVQAEAKLRALLEISGSLQSTLLIEEILPRVLNSVFRIFPDAQWGFILLLDESSGELIPAASRGHQGGVAGPVRISRTIVQQALDRRQAILSADAHADAQFDVSKSISIYGIHSILCAPLLKKGGQPLGILQLHSEQKGRAFTAQDLDLVVHVAGAVAMAIENARLHQDLVARERLVREAELARDVQGHFLPKSEPKIAGYEFFGYYAAARMVGGDYYSFTPLSGGRLAIAVGDVSGKGMPAAMLMARLSSDVRYSAIAFGDPAAALEAVNGSLAEAGIEDKFVTLLLLVLDPVDHTLTLANAGHPPPLLRRANGSVEELGAAAAGFPLNVDRSRGYRSFAAPLAPGETVLAYTDGLSEARDREGRLYGEAAMREALRDAPPAPASAGKAIVEAALRFAAGEPPHDDVTLVAFGRTGP